MCLMRGHPVPQCAQGVQDRQKMNSRKKKKPKQNKTLLSAIIIFPVIVNSRAHCWNFRIFVQRHLRCNEIRVRWLFKVESLERTVSSSPCQPAINNVNRKEGLIGCYGDEVNNEMAAKVKKDTVQCFFNRFTKVQVLINQTCLCLFCKAQVQNIVKICSGSDDIFCFGFQEHK